MSYRSQRRYSTDSSDSSSSGGWYDGGSVRSGSRSSNQQSARSQTTVRSQVWRCGECCREFATQQGLSCHITTVHERPRSSTSSREPELDFGRVAIRGAPERFPCQRCGSDYASQGNLNRHMREYHGQGAGAPVTNVTVRRHTNIQNNINIQNNYIFNYRK